ncbi:MAG: hypothetical protein ACXW2I_15895, partial [Burkholderiales bacterium]
MAAIDVHAHWFPPEWVALLEAEGNANGAKMGKNAKGWTNITIPGVALVSSFQPDMVDLDTMIAEMDRAAIDVRVFSLTNPMVYWAGPEFGLKLSRTWNDASSAAHTEHPDRFIGTMMLPPQVTMIPIFIMWNSSPFMNTYVPLIAPWFFGSAFFIFMLRQF